MSIVRTGIADWNEFSTGQIAQERAKLDAAAAHGLLCWVWLGDLPNFCPAASTPGRREQLLAKVVNALKGHAALGAWKGVDEPRNRFRGDSWIRPAGLIRGYQRVKLLDPNHPLVITHAPRQPRDAAHAVPPGVRHHRRRHLPGLVPARHPQRHRQQGSQRGRRRDNEDDELRPAEAVWMTLQIAWSGVVPTRHRPGLVPRFPSLHDERFMAYQAIVNGARGLAFFGGHLTQVTTPADAKAGWNWTFWDRVLQPLVAELTSDQVHPALVAPNARAVVKASASDVEVVTRQDGRTLWVIAVRRGGSTSVVTFKGLPSKADGQQITQGEVLPEYVQDPLPPPIGAGQQVFRKIPAANASFKDWSAPTMHGSIASGSSYPESMPLTSARQVIGPTMPSDAIPRAVWKPRTKVSVRGPKMPSI